MVDQVDLDIEELMQNHSLSREEAADVIRLMKSQDLATQLKSVVFDMQV